ncbi:MAG: 4Fe-4S binding protein [Desulfarculaceae bacterium]|jgi:2-oxoglutarate ferredoxin oxidoreductase subunit delta
MNKVFIISESCKGTDDCGICAFVCPKELFTPSPEMNQAGYIPPQIIDQSECIGCKNCMISCPDMAIVVEAEESEVAK